MQKIIIAITIAIFISVVFTSCGGKASKKVDKEVTLNIAHMEVDAVCCYWDPSKTCLIHVYAKTLSGSNPTILFNKKYYYEQPGTTGQIPAEYYDQAVTDPRYLPNVVLPSTGQYELVVEVWQINCEECCQFCVGSSGRPWFKSDEVRKVTPDTPVVFLHFDHCDKCY